MVFFFLNRFLFPREDKRPGLVFSRTQARKYELEKKHEEKRQKNRESQVSVRELEEKRRNDALHTSSLTADNKGFSLMLKMGYRKGEALGKETSTIAAVAATVGTSKNSDDDETSIMEPRVKVKRGLIEPIPIVVKSDRVGLGRESANAAKLAEMRQTQQRVQTTYLDKKRSSFQLRKLLHSFHKCQRVCFHLDTTTTTTQQNNVISQLNNISLSLSHF